MSSPTSRSGSDAAFSSAANSPSVSTRSWALVVRSAKPVGGSTVAHVHILTIRGLTVDNDANSVSADLGKRPLA